MTPARAAKILRLYNAWRRGYGEQSDVPSPELIGEAIDVAVGYITRAKPTKRAPAQRKEES